MSRFDRFIDNKLAQNLFIWGFLFLILIATIQADNRVLVALFAVFLLAPAVYINNLLVLPLLRKKLWLFFVFFLLNAIVFTITSVLLTKELTEQPLELMMFVNFFGIMILALVFATAIKLARDSFIRRQHEKEAELKLLKAQLNPHFLFNTLNNLYGLSVVKSEKLPDLMLKLSDLLRYSLYETKETLVPLQKEIAYVQNYISLEKIRLEDSANIELEKSGDFTSHQIAPMLLIVFVENSFKHLGVLNDEKSTVLVSIREKDNTLHFSCQNTLDIGHDDTKNLEQGRSGIGLQNVQKRLALLYPEKHTLAITKTESDYKVELTLDL